MRFSSLGKVLKYLSAFISTAFTICLSAVTTAASLPLGTIDPAFDPNINHGSVSSIAMMPNGDVMFGGFFSHFSGSTSSGGVSRYRLGSVTSTGQLTNFDVAVNGGVYTLAAQPDGKLIVGGNYNNIAGTSEKHIVRLTTTGLRDSGFKLNFNISNTVYASLVQPDGSIVIGGYFNHSYAGGVVRLSSTGMYSFANNYSPTPNAQVSALALQPDGMILIGGVFTTLYEDEITARFIGRVTQTGRVDTSFSDPNINSFGNVHTIAVQEDGRILIGGAFTTLGGLTRNRIARLTSTGLVDPSFDANVNNVIHAIKLQSDGKILIGGLFTGVGGTQITGFARLTTTGLLDTSLNVGVRSNVNGVQAEVFAIGLDPSEGSVIIGGTFNIVGGLIRNRAARIGLAPPCGNNIVDSGEQCDDGNTDGGDGCSNVCTLEVPSCTLTPTVTSGFINFTIGFTGVVLNTGATIKMFYNHLGQGGGNGAWTGYRTFGPYTIAQTGTFMSYMEIANVYSGSITNTCDAVFTGYAPGITIGGCGDGIVQGGEQCDDWGLQDGDGCSSTCQLETPSCIVTATPSNVSAGGQTSIIFTGISGLIGNRSVMNEGNGGGGTADAPIRVGTHTFNVSGTYLASGTVYNPFSGSMQAYCSITGTVYANICGNGVLQGAEQCDDNNTANGDGCSSTCTIETPSCTIAVSPLTGYTPLLINVYATGSSYGVFSMLNLGNGIMYTGNRTGTVQTGYTYTTGGAYIVTGVIANPYSGLVTNMCSTTFSLTTSACGDGVIQEHVGEQCDDNNTDSNDGCSNTCQLEMPSCSLTANPANGYTPLNVGLTGLASHGGVFSYLAWNDLDGGSDNMWTGYIATGYSYTIAGAYNVTGTVVNPYSGSMSAMCTTTIEVTQAGGGPVRVIPTDNCPDGDYSPTPYDNQCGTRPGNNNGANNSTLTGATTVTGTSTTGASSGTGITFTGTNVPNIPEILPLEPNFPAVPILPSIPSGTSDLYMRARSNDITTLPLEEARPEDTVLRYELAKMLVNFAENVMHARIPHNPLCVVETYGDYETFDAEMEEMIRKTCDLGLMGWSIRNVKILDRFRPFDTLSVEELNIVIERYLGHPVNVESNSRIDIWQFLMNASK